MGRRTLLAAAALTLILAGCGGSPYPEASVPFRDPGAPATAVAPSASPLPAVGGTHLVISKIGVDTELVPLGLNPDGTHQVPPVEQSEVAGWFDLGPKPGDVGPSIILGHINGGGKPGVFARLGELVVGDVITIAGRDWKVSEIESVDKDEFPAAKVYGETAGPELRLVTCGGAFDQGSGHYTGNVIVYAS